MTAAELRKQQAQAGKDKIAAREQDMKDRQSHINDIKANTKAKVDDDLLDDEIDIDGDGKADMTAAELRKQQAQAGKDKVAAREQDMKDRQAHIDDIKTNTKAKADDDLLDYGIDTDGDGKADTTQAEMRA